MALAGASVSTTTLKKYATAWKYWRRFLIETYALPPGNYTDAQLDTSNVTPRERLELILCWIHYLQHSSGLNLSSEYVNQLLSGLRYKFRVSWIDTSIFDHPLVRACKSGLARDPRKASTKQHRTRPMTLGMVDYILSRYPPDGINVDKALLGIAVVFAFTCLLRPSEFCSDTSADHAYRANSVLFECTIPGSSRPIYRTAANLRDITWPQVQLVKLTMRHAKNIQFRTGKSMWFSSDPTPGVERKQITEYLFQWAQRAQLQNDSLLMSHRITTGGKGVYRKLQYRHFITVIKEAAAHFQFDTTHFAGYSPRIGGASLLRAAGASDGFIKLMGRWKTLPACLTYQETSTKACDLMLGLLSVPGLYTERDVALAQEIIPSLLPSTAHANSLALFDAQSSDSDSDLE